MITNREGHGHAVATEGMGRGRREGPVSTAGQGGQGSRLRATCRTAPQWRRRRPSGRAAGRRRISPQRRSRCQSAMAMCPENVSSSTVMKMCLTATKYLWCRKANPQVTLSQRMVRCSGHGTPAMPVASSPLAGPGGTAGPGPVRSGLVTDRAVLVTGGSRGIGRAIVEAFAKLGDRVAVHHRDSAALAAEVVAGLPGSGHTVVQADLADPEAVREAVDAACKTLGGLDVLVNNAGIFTPHSITEVFYAEWQ